MTLRPFCLCIALVALTGSPASAQIKPASSGELSFHEPEMRPHRSGFYRPNRSHLHRRQRRHAFFR